MDKRYNYKGLVYFVYSNGEVVIYYLNKEETDFAIKLAKVMTDNKMFEEAIESTFSEPIYHLMSGEEFLEDIESGCLTDYDGYVNAIFVDGYKSNLGLFTKNYQSNNFLVDKEEFLKLCTEHKIEVDWVNK